MSICDVYLNYNNQSYTVAHITYIRVYIKRKSLLF